MNFDVDSQKDVVASVRLTRERMVAMVKQARGRYPLRQEKDPGFFF